MTLDVRNGRFHFSILLLLEFLFLTFHWSVNTVEGALICVPHTMTDIQS